MDKFRWILAFFVGCTLLGFDAFADENQQKNNNGFPKPTLLGSESGDPINPFDYNPKAVLRENLIPKDTTASAGEKPLLPIGTVAGWTSATLTAVGLIADFVERSETRRFQERLMTLLEEMDGKLDHIILSIQDLKKHINVSVESSRVKNFTETIESTASSYANSYTGMLEDKDYAMRRSDLLIHDLQKSTYIVKKKGISYFPLVASSLLLENDLMYFNRTPDSVRPNVIREYRDYFEFAITGDDNFTDIKNEAYIKQSRLENKYRSHRPTYSHQQTVHIDDFVVNDGCDFGGRKYLITAVVLHESNSHRMSAPKHLVKAQLIGSNCGQRDRDPRNVNDRKTERMESINPFEVTSFEKSSNACWGELGNYCSQVYKPYEIWLRSKIHAWNNQHEALRQASEKANGDLEIASNLLDTAIKYRDLADRMLAQPNNFKPNGFKH